MELKHVFGILLAGGILISCSNENGSDAYGQFEADGITISAEVPGKLLQFNVEEGAVLQAGTLIAVTDTSMLILNKKELEASIRSVRSQLSNLNAQADVYKEQLKTAEKDLARLKALKEGNAATQKQLDDAQGMINTLKSQISAVEVQKQSVYAEIETMKTRIAKVEDQLAKAKIVNPLNGTVLSTYADQFELVAQGKPLYRIADTSELILRVYVSGAQLPQVRLGQTVQVLIDKDAESNESLSGTVSWISSEAEFTPKMIQTKEERVTQLYAVKVRVPNPDGKIKIGMPGEVVFDNE